METDWKNRGTLVSVKTIAPVVKVSCIELKKVERLMVNPI